MGICASGPPSTAITQAELLHYYQLHARGWVEAVPFTYRYYIVNGGDPDEPGTGEEQLDAHCIAAYGVGLESVKAPRPGAAAAKGGAPAGAASASGGGGGGGADTRATGASGASGANGAAASATAAAGGDGGVQRASTKFYRSVSVAASAGEDAPLLRSRVRIRGHPGRPGLDGTCGYAITWSSEKTAYYVILETRPVSRMDDE